MRWGWAEHGGPGLGGMVGRNGGEESREEVTCPPCSPSISKKWIPLAPSGVSYIGIMHLCTIITASALGVIEPQLFGRKIIPFTSIV